MNGSEIFLAGWEEEESLICPAECMPAEDLPNLQSSSRALMPLRLLGKLSGIL